MLKLNKKYVNDKLLIKEKMPKLKGFILTKYIENAENIIIVNKNLAHPIVTKEVGVGYAKLLDEITKLIDKDFSKENCVIALNMMEIFRMQIKSKYRNNLKKKEIREMSYRLKKIKKQLLLQVNS